MKTGTGWQEPLFFCLAGIDPGKGVQRAETDEAGQDKYTTQDHQYQPRRTGYRTAEIQVSEYGGDQYPDNTIGISHVLFHICGFML